MKVLFFGGRWMEAHGVEAQFHMSVTSCVRTVTTSADPKHITEALQTLLHFLQNGKASTSERTEFERVYYTPILQTLLSKLSSDWFHGLSDDQRTELWNIFFLQGPPDQALLVLVKSISTIRYPLEIMCDRTICGYVYKRLQDCWTSQLPDKIMFIMHVIVLYSLSVTFMSCMLQVFGSCVVFIGSLFVFYSRGLSLDCCVSVFEVFLNTGRVGVLLQSCCLEPNTHRDSAHFSEDVLNRLAALPTIIANRLGAHTPMSLSPLQYYTHLAHHIFILLERICTILRGIPNSCYFNNHLLLIFLFLIYY